MRPPVDVAEDNILPLPLPDTKGDPNRAAISWQWIRNLIEEHPDLGRTFQTVEVSPIGRLRFVMGAELKDSFPEDDAVSSALIASPA